MLVDILVDAVLGGALAVFVQLVAFKNSVGKQHTVFIGVVVTLFGIQAEPAAGGNGKGVAEVVEVLFDGHEGILCSAAVGLEVVVLVIDTLPGGDLCSAVILEIVVVRQLAEGYFLQTLGVSLAIFFKEEVTQKSRPTYYVKRLQFYTKSYL